MHAFQAMNADFRTSGLDEPGQRRAESWFAFIEDHLSRFRQNSELVRLSREAGSPFVASPLLYEAVSAAYRYYMDTEGLFNQFLASDLSGLGYNVSFEHIQQTGDTHSPESTIWKGLLTGAGEEANKRGTGSAFRSRIQFNPLHKSILLEQGAALDLGGIAKGWSAERLSVILKREGVLSGAIDAGGDIVIWGSDESFQTLSIADPLDGSKDLMSLEVGAKKGIATSSILKRSWIDSSGIRRHHIIDPRTLRPAESDLLQVTVWGPSLTAAEVYAKCVLILGSVQGKGWLENRHPHYSAIGVAGNGSIMAAGKV